MKAYVVIFLACLSLFLLQPSAFAQEATPEPTTVTPLPTKEESKLDDTIKSLKDKIEDKVEQINKSSKKIIKGIITSAKDGTLKLETDTDNTFTVSLDETITSFFMASVDDHDAIEQSDLKESDYVLVSGPIIEDQVSANIVYKQTPYLVLQGQITAVDKSAFTIDVITLEKDSYTLDIEDDTTQFLMNSKTLALEKAGFSKYQVGDTLHFVVVKPEAGKTKLTVVRTLIIPQEYFVEDPTGQPAGQ